MKPEVPPHRCSILPLHTENFSRFLQLLGLVILHSQRRYLEHSTMLSWAAYVNSPSQLASESYTSESKNVTEGIPTPTNGSK